MRWACVGAGGTAGGTCYPIGGACSIATGGATCPTQYEGCVSGYCQMHCGPNYPNVICQICNARLGISLELVESILVQPLSPASQTFGLA